MSTAILAPLATALRAAALAGNPNSGKTTVFNGLTGLRQKVANYPGVTVERKVGRCRLPAATIDVIDLPGTYSLVPSSLDEQVTTEVLYGRRADTARPDVVAVVVDASNLARSLYLVTQLIDLGRPLVVALNMVDIAERRGLAVDAEALARELGAPVVPMVGNRGRGIAELKAALANAQVPASVRWAWPAALRAAITELGTHVGPDQHGRDTAFRLLTADGQGIPREQAERLAAEVARARAGLASAGVDPVEADIIARYQWIDGVVARVVRASATADRPTLTERVDGMLMHPVWGLAAFALVMGGVFTSVFKLAQPLMDGIQAIQGWLAELVTAHLAPGPLQSLLTDGVIGGVGAVITFLPQILILFLLLAVLEDSGYLARAAFLMDRLLSRVGLHGKSFIPLLSSFACAIPGILATRTIDSRKDRLATILVAPFMTCSARLPVYTLLIEACFAPALPKEWQAATKGLIMLGCYLAGIVIAALAAWALRLSVLRRGAPSTFILEMPSYKLPQLTEVARQMWVNSKSFLTKAGTVIFMLSVLLWAAMYWPRLDQAHTDRIALAVRQAAPASGDARSIDERIEDRTQAEQVAHSYAGQFGHAIAPALAPIGVDWKTGIGLVGAFAAREVFVSTLGIVHGVGDTEKRGGAREALPAAMRADRRADGRLVWTPLAAASVLVWFVIAMQCMSTIAVVRRETGGWGWPIFMLVSMNVLAYACCLGVYQVGMRLFGA